MENGEFLGPDGPVQHGLRHRRHEQRRLGQLAESLYASQALQASSMIGKSVLTEGNLAHLVGRKSPLAGCG